MGLEMALERRKGHRIWDHGDSEDAIGMLEGDRLEKYGSHSAILANNREERYCS